MIYESRFSCVAVLLFSLFCASCSVTAPKPKSLVKATQAGTPHQRLAIVWNVDDLTVDVDMAFYPVDGNGLAASASSAVQNTPGAGPAGFLGAILATQMIKSSQETNAQNRVNAPIAALNKQLPDRLSQDVVANYFGAADFAVPVDGIAKGAVHLRPIMNMSPDYRCLQTRLRVEVVDQKKRVLFRNEYSYTGAPILGGSTDPASRWAENDAALFLSELQVALERLRPLVESELLVGEAKLASSAKAIRYANSAGRFYVRGELLEKDVNRLVYRDLRGAIHSVHFEKML